MATSEQQQFKWQRNSQLNKSNKIWEKTEAIRTLQATHTLDRKMGKRSENQTIVNAKINRILSFSLFCQHSNPVIPAQGQQLP